MFKRVNSSWLDRSWTTDLSFSLCLSLSVSLSVCLCVCVCGEGGISSWHAEPSALLLSQTHSQLSWRSSVALLSSPPSSAYIARVYPSSADR